MAASTDLDLLTLQSNLADARIAYHQLQTGQAAVVVVDQNGERVQFTSANRQGLYAYIQQLISQITAASTSTPATTGPLGFMF